LVGLSSSCIGHLAIVLLFPSICLKKYRIIILGKESLRYDEQSVAEMGEVSGGKQREKKQWPETVGIV